MHIHSVVFAVSRQIKAKGMRKHLISFGQVMKFL